MTKYSPEEIESVLARADVQKVLDKRRAKGGRCCGGCGTVVPTEMDSDIILIFRNALKVRNIEWFIPEPRFFLASWHPRGVECEYENQSAQRWIDPNNREFSETYRSIYDVVSTRPIVLRDGVWVLGETTTSGNPK